ncbi:MAG TPA: L-histidine N(alpha)-methyltransferase [Gammaproteobacteria bacterium]|nr:L-histidine N(alpha)-methyltransferase [Gammaproteobacteria bacterium]
MSDGDNAVPALHDFEPHEDDSTAEILKGLAATPKRISPKYFYDERGSQLFDAITELPEYYPTRTELAIMRENVGEIARLVGPDASLIEFGSGSSLKTQILLENLDRLAAYVPVDISKEHLLAAAERIAAQFPHIEVLPVCADFTQPFELPDPRVTPVRNLVYFPGSTIGNFQRPQALALLKAMSRVATEGGALLIGVDLDKDPRIITRAYNDSAGVTAEFNLNMLAHLNREYRADFDLTQFEHRAVYDRGDTRIEMQLVSRRAQTVTLSGRRIKFREGEHIITEYSHKYAREEFAQLAGEAGFAVERVWTDAEELFSVQFLVCTAD